MLMGISFTIDWYRLMLLLFGRRERSKKEHVIREEENQVDIGGLPGSGGEHRLQEKFGATARARAFYRSQLRDRLNPWMQKFIAEQEMAFIASADARGACDCSFRAGMKGFIRVVDERTVAYSEYHGNGVYASLGNLLENPHIGILLIDFFHHTIGLHVNGMATIVEELLRRPNVPEGLRREVESVMRITKIRLRYRFRVAAGLRDRRSSESWRATRSDAQPTSW
jgi:predicted pyridoxine 5'-phosphate oxidase superfamily flavin-nucleotide-binding protein